MTSIFTFLSSFSHLKPIPGSVEIISLATERRRVEQLLAHPHINYVPIRRTIEPNKPPIYLHLIFPVCNIQLAFFPSLN